MNTMAKNFRWARLSLGGAVFGVVVAHALENYFAPHSGVAVQSVGALSGTAIAAIVAKVAHIV